MLPDFGMIAEVLHNHVYHLTNVNAFGWAHQAQFFPSIGKSGHITKAKCSLGWRVGSAIVVQCVASFEGCVHFCEIQNNSKVPATSAISRIEKPSLYR